MDRLGVEVPVTGGWDGPSGARGTERILRPAAERREAASDLLEITLEAAVPLRVLELRHASDGERARLASEASAQIAEHGDVILYRSPRRGDTATAVGWLITGLACAAHQPGGVRFRNLGWCAAHLAHRWAPEERVCAQCAEEARPTATRGRR